MIEASEVTFTYPKKKEPAIAGVSMSIPSGEIFTLLGPNGAGKSTMIRMLSGLTLPHQGQITICGQNLRRQEYAARRRIGLVLGDERTFYYRLTGAQNLEFFGGLYGFTRSTLRRRVQEVLSLVGLEKDGGSQFMRYSSGMKRRLSIARAILHEPPVLLLDEPNTGVDPESARRIRQIILALKQEGRCILLATHDMEEAEMMSDRIGFLKNGRLIRVGSLRDYKNLIREEGFIAQIDPSTIPSPETVKEIIAELQSEMAFDYIGFRPHQFEIKYNGTFDLNRVLQAIIQRNLRIEQVNTVGPSLEDVFIKLAGC
jgi:ABC-2 type transport system ATP-binding protein